MRELRMSLMSQKTIFFVFGGATTTASGTAEDEVRKYLEDFRILEIVPRSPGTCF
jgi:hypothetical protein